MLFEFRQLLQGRLHDYHKGSEGHGWLYIDGMVKGHNDRERKGKDLVRVGGHRLVPWRCVSGNSDRKNRTRDCWYH